MSVYNFLLFCLIVIKSGVNSYTLSYDNEMSDDFTNNMFTTYGSEDSKTVYLPNGEVVRCDRILGTNSFSIMTYNQRERFQPTFDDNYSNEELSPSNFYRRKKRDYVNDFFGSGFQQLMNNNINSAINYANRAVANANKQVAAATANANKQVAAAMANANKQVAAAGRLVKKYKEICRKAFSQ